MALLPEEVLVKKLVEYAGGLSELQEAVRRATKKASGVPDLKTLLQAIEEVRNEARSEVPVG